MTNTKSYRIGDPFTNPITEAVGKIVQLDAYDFQVRYDLGDGMTGSAWYSKSDHGTSPRFNSSADAI